MRARKKRTLVMEDIKRRIDQEKEMQNIDESEAYMIVNDTIRAEK